MRTLPDRSGLRRIRVGALALALLAGTMAAVTRAPNSEASATTGPRTGYWMVASDGGIFSIGDAAFYGSTGAIKLNKPIVGMAATPSGHGYWMVASDGGIFSFGDAAFQGSTGGMILKQPIVGMASTPSGNGYWLVAADGGVLAYGDAVYFGAATGKAGTHPVVAMIPTPTGRGYWEVSDGGQSFDFGDAWGTASIHTDKPVVGAATLPTGVAPGVVSGTGGSVRMVSARTQSDARL